MKGFYLFCLFLMFLIVNSQDPEIVDEIWPEVQQVGRTGRLNCTVANKQTNVVSPHRKNDQII